MEKKRIVLLIVSVLTILIILSYFIFRYYDVEKSDESWLNSSGDTESDGVFEDVSDTYWAKEYILYLTQRDIMFGDSNGNFNPEKDITCEEFLIMLSKVSMPMIDYTKSNVNELISILTQKNVFYDDELSKEFLDSKLTNYNAAVMMAKFDINVREAEQEITFLEYNDIDSLNEVDKSLIGHSVKCGFVKVKDKAKFYPDKIINRAIAAEMVYNFINSK